MASRDEQYREAAARADKRRSADIAAAMPRVSQDGSRSNFLGVRPAIDSTAQRLGMQSEYGGFNTVYSPYRPVHVPGWQIGIYQSRGDYEKAQNWIRQQINMRDNKVQLSQADRIDNPAIVQDAIGREQNRIARQVSRADRSEDAARALFGDQQAISDDEKYRWSAEGMNDFDPEQIPGVFTGKQTPEEAARAEANAAQDSVFAGLIEYESQNLNDMVPGYDSTPVDTPEVALSTIAMRHPTLFVAMVNQGFTPQEIRAGANFALANDAADELISSLNPYRQNQILAAQGTPAQQALVLAIAGEKVKEQAEEAAAAGNPDDWGILRRLADPVWGFTGENLLNWAFTAQDVALHGVRTFTMLPDTEMAYKNAGYNPFERLAALPQIFKTAWDITAPGYISPYAVQQYRDQYGDKPVDLVLEALALRNAQESDVIGTMYEQYAGDAEALAILDEVFFETSADEGIMQMRDDIMALDQGNLGNLIGRSMGLDPSSFLFTATRDTVNIGSIFLFDPLLMGGKFAKFAKGLRYGIHKMAPGRLDKTFASRKVGGVETNTVRLYFDDLGQRLKGANEIEDSTERAARLTSIERQEKKYLTTDVLKGMVDAKIFSADDAVDFFRNADNMRLLLMGQPFHRGVQMYTPHAGRVRLLTKQLGLMARGMDPTMAAKRAGVGTFNEIMDEAAAVAGVSDMLIVDGVQTPFSRLPNNVRTEIVKKVTNDPKGSEVLGKGLSDFTGEVTLLGKGIRKALPESFVKKYRLDQRGLWRRGGVRTTFDRWSRLMARRPNGANGIEIADASDADTVYQLLRYLGTPRYFATEMRQLWIDANPGQRRLMLTGLTRTGAYAAGIDLVAGSDGVEDLMRTVTASRASDRYAANMVPGADRMLREAREEAEQKLGGRLNLDESELEADWIDELVDQRNKIDEELAAAQAAAPEAEINALVAEREAIQKEIDALRADQLRGEMGFNEEEIAAFEREARDTYLDEVVFDVDGGQVTVREMLDKFTVPESAQRTLPPLSFRAVKDSPGVVRAKAEDGYWTISRQSDGQYAVTKPDGSEAGVYATQKAAKEAANVATGQSRRAVGGNAFPANAAEEKMLLLGYLPERWAKAWKSGGNRSASAYSEDEYARFVYGGAVDEGTTVVPDWTAVVESAIPASMLAVPGVKSGKWIPIDWYQAGLRREVDNLIGQNTIPDEALDEIATRLEGLGMDTDNLTQRIDAIRNGNIPPSASPEVENLRRALAEIDDEIAAERASGARTVAERAGDGAPIDARELENLTRKIWYAKLQQAGFKDPSRKDGLASAVWTGQTSSRIAIPDLGLIDQMAARQSYLNVLLGNNRAIGSITDAWVFATLAGPRFSIRNVIEDYGFWWGTGGSGIREGRRAAQAKRQVIVRVDNDPKVIAAKSEVERRAAAYAKLKEDNTANTADLIEAERQLKVANDALAVAEGNVRLKTQQLGFVKTAMRRGATWVTDRRWFKDQPETWQSSMKAMLHPYLSDAELKQATELYVSGDRSDLSRLLAKAYVRERVLYLDNPNMKNVQDWIRTRNGDTSKLSAKDQETLQYLEDFVMGRNGLEYMSMVAEEGRHMLDGLDPALVGASDMTVIGNEVLQRLFIDGGYVNVKVTGRNPRAVDGVYRSLVFALQGDGPKGQRAMFLLDEWMGADAKRRAELVDDLAAFIASDNAGVGYATKFSLVNDTDFRGLAERTMLALEGMFTKRTGGFNRELYNALRRVPDDSDIPSFKLWDRDPKTGEPIYRVEKSDFRDGNFEMPLSYLGFDGVEALIPADRSRIVGYAWDAMGRTMARWSREPMFMANYLDARRSLKEFEPLWQDAYGDGWRKVADEIATERAYMLTLGYVDNPAVRSQLAWQVRNVARFYRALEDFNRRMYRVATNNPMFFYKAALAFNIGDDSGFTHTDEYGQEYFIYPGTPALFSAMNAAMNVLNIGGLQAADLPLAFGGRTEWLTPSADPDSWAPTFSGVYSSFALRPVLRAMPIMDKVYETLTGKSSNDAFKDFGRSTERNLFGEIGLDMSGLETIAPPNVLRAFGVAQALIDDPQDASQEMTGQVASSLRAAIQAGVAGGWIPTDRALSESERAKILGRLDGVALGILVTRFLLGMVVPASPQLTQNDVGAFAREIGGADSLRSAFKQLTNTMTYDEAIVAWFTANPDKAPYVLGEAGGRENTGSWNFTQETADWVQSNKDVVQEYRIGASLFAPWKQDAPFELSAYRFLERNGLVQKSTIGDYLQSMTTQQGWVQYQIMQAEYQQRLTDIAGSTEPEDMKQAMRLEEEARWRNIKADLFGYYQGLEARATGTSDRPLDVTVEDIRGAATMLADRGDEKAKDVLDLLASHDEIKSTMESIDETNPEYDSIRDDLRSKWEAMVLEWNNYYSGDRNFNSILRMMTANLNFRVEGL